KIRHSQRAFTDVWADYPEGTEDAPLFRNYFTVVDTVWTSLPAGSCGDRINFVNNKLWLKGNFGGEQTWWSSSDIEIVGDISLRGTPTWQNPFGNNTDKVNLVSENNIVIKYGYKDPVGPWRYHPNMGSDDWYQSPAGGGVWLYASLYALGNGGGDPREDGVFTFEYQHPHPSVESTITSTQDGIPTMLDWIDLHRYHYPQTAEHPWPANIDYPWYNPLWPEQDPYLERGTINIWGSLMQRRRGYVHRDYYDTPGNTVWNPALGLYGGSSSPEEGFIDPVLGVNMQTRNYPGAGGNGVGYKKNYNYNVNSTLSDCWDVEDSGNLWGMGLNLSNWSVTNGMERYYRKQYLLAPQDKCFARKGERAYYSIDDQLLYADLDDVTDISASTTRDGIIRSIALSPDATPFVYQLAETDGMYFMTVKNINPASGIVNYETTIEVPTLANDVCVLPNGRRLMAVFDNLSSINLWEITSQGIMTHVESWQIDAGLLPSEARLKTCRLYMLLSANDRVEVFFYVPADATTPGSNGALYHAYAGFPVSNEDYTVPAVPIIEISAYPNPMRDELKLLVENAQASKLSIDVYNIRGQLVHRIPLPSQGSLPKIEYTWDGKDSNKQRVANGIYVLRLMADNKAVSTKRFCRY
ncbi:MAG: FlgD immunoglobulin-like domain containing protein, partial [Candidatus Cloacimonetes bacterium]|nr:FlgD immunoglobulin-like domain containing protein [Candidatus Cloacimonadota bacterium]